jgi:hypothetical protein
VPGVKMHGQVTGHLQGVFRLLADIALSGREQQAKGQTCRGGYTITDDEPRADAIRRVCGSPSRWTLIFYANQDWGALGALLDRQ